MMVLLGREGKNSGVAFALAKKTRERRDADDNEGEAKRGKNFLSFSHPLQLSLFTASRSSGTRSGPCGPAAS